MKTQFKNPIGTFILMFFLWTTVFLLGFGCSTPKPTPDPLAGFHPAALYTPDTNKTITDDYKNYIQKLSPEERKFIAGIEFFEDGTGQHAVKITIGLNHINWRHVLIYDKDNKRINTIKYISGNSAS
jgi:hypothetical protein